MKAYIQLIKATINRWLKNEPFQQSAVIAYYALFSLPSLMVIIISVAGYFFGKSTVQDQLMDQIADVVGREAAVSVERLMTNVDVEDGSTVALAISIGVLVFGATGAFFQLKKAMNKIWRVREKKSNVVMVVLDRLISLSLILVIGIMLIASLILTTLIQVLGHYISDYAPMLTSAVLSVFNFLFSYIFIGFLFAAIFKILPDVKIRWRTTFIGASVTTVLFLLAVYGLGFYFGQSDPTSVFGGASSVILIMLWIYYSCLIMFLGAEFTVQYALKNKEKLKPGRFSEPAYIQDLADLKERAIYLEDQKEFLKKWAEEMEDQDCEKQKKD